MAKSVIIIGINYEYTDKLAQAVAFKLNKMFLSVHDLMVYEMRGLVGNIENIDDEYVNSKLLIAKINAFDYEDSIISIDVSSISDAEVKDAMSTLCKIYAVHKDENDEFMVVYNERDEILKNIANFTLKEEDFDKQVNETIAIIQKLNLNEGI